MPAFDYSAMDNQGRKQKGVLEADSARLARQLLRDRQLIPLAVSEAQQRESSGVFGGHRIGASDLSLATRQLATLLQAGLPIEECLSAVASQTERHSVRRVLMAVRTQVREGHTLAGSLQQFPRAFPTLYCATVSAGEKSGHLDGVLNRLADYTEAQLEFRQKIQLAMLYPVLLLVLSLAIVIGLMVYVVPDIIDTIADAGQQLPLLTEILVSISNFLSTWGGWLALGIAAAALFIRALLQRPHIRLGWHKKLLSLPFTRKFSRGGNAARYISTLAILTNSGIPLVESMGIAKSVVKNDAFAEALEQADKSVTEGIALNRALGQSGYFPPMMIHLIASGEASGELPALLQKAADAQEKELQRIVATMVGILEPATLVIMGGFILAIVLAVMLPILNLNQIVG
ncbi:type II secretion system inner membrane protein GspF [Porticoccus sp. W117]|uniref:type II secretion system inner membrane protein GspF n=1 Tax=Porticoccus sp. W117 TaxID=3054777 RepID=UPI002594625A|nr:type II secretion system inner membrane protein GspF [Porticoccus sp. W117]MDM3872569.1 type II secretion system inner membrane protein GspF [Porticoccus sp. W117]